METVFIKLLNMSIVAGWLIVAVILLRFLLKKAPKWIVCVLWAFVAVRLVCPISVESAMSLIPSVKVIEQDIIYSEEPSITTGISYLNSTVNPILQENLSPTPGDSANPIQIWTIISANIWLLGAILLLLYASVSYLRLRKKVSTAVRLEENIWQSEYVISPFILGIIRPRIYLPFQMEGQEKEYVIAHEKAHLARKDHWWKPLGYLLLCIYWFNPLCWAAYWLFCKDIEMACDEKVVANFDLQDKKCYSKALVSCSVVHRNIAACPLAFGEMDVKKRIKNVLSYKKPTFWIMIAAIFICIVMAVCFLTNPKKEDIIYCIEETIYDSQVYSFTYTPESYWITKEGHLKSKGEITGTSSGWTDLGKLSEFTLTKENFDFLFEQETGETLNGGWHTGEKGNAETIREGNAKSRRLTYNYENGYDTRKILYYVLEQKNGEVYLAYGYDNESAKDEIRWLFQLAKEIEVEKVPEGYTLEDALKDDLVVMSDGDVMSGQEKWDDFYEATLKGKPASIKLAYHYTLGDKSRYDEEYYESIKDEYPMLFVTYLSYDGSRYTVSDYSDGEQYIKTYAYLMRYEEEAVPTAKFTREVTYFLVNDNTVTWDDIWTGLLSSQSGAYIEHRTVYTDLIY